MGACLLVGEEVVRVWAVCKSDLVADKLDSVGCNCKGMTVLLRQCSRHVVYSYQAADSTANNSQRLTPSPQLS